MPVALVCVKTMAQAFESIKNRNVSLAYISDQTGKEVVYY